MKKFNSIYTAVKGAGLVGLLAAGSSAAMAADFDATATVQNALEVTVVNGMNLGTIFATRAVSSSVGVLRLSPDGTITNPISTATTGAPSIIALGGQDPARASITVGSREPLTITLPVAASDDELSSDDRTGADQGDTAPGAIANMVELRLGGAGGDPSVARLYLANFSVGAVTGGSITDDTSNSDAETCSDATRIVDEGDEITCEITPSFGSTLVEFAIGADIVTDISATRTTYEEGTYEGTFEVTATY